MHIKAEIYLFEWHLYYPLPEAYVYNLVQICPRHATHDIIPVTEQNRLSFSNATSHNIHAVSKR